MAARSRSSSARSPRSAAARNSRSVQPIFFPSSAAFRDWLEAHHATARELLAGFYKRHTGEPTMTWVESVEEALCFGWIDGVRRSLDARRYTIRFTPRKPGSYWSAVNTRHAQRLIESGRMRPAGLAAFERRDAARTKRYSYERETATLSAADRRAFGAAPGAWAFFRAQPHGYQRLETIWITSAKRPETRAKRLAAIVERSAKGERMPWV